MKLFYVVLLCTFFLLSCTKSNKNEKIINLSNTTILNEQVDLHHVKTFKVAISAMMSPVQNYDVYKPFLKYLQDALSMQVKLTQRKTYLEVNDLIKDNKVDLAFICTGAYVYGDLKNKANVIAIPVVNNKITYKAYIIVNKQSNINSIWDLKGKSFAFMDPLSNTGYFFPMDLFKQYGINPKTFFKSTSFTYSHTFSIEAVANNIVSAASVDGIVYNYAIKHSPKLRKNTKILIESPTFAMPPVVVPKQMDEKMQKKIQDILLSMDKNSKGRKILKEIGVDKFILPPKNFYDSIYYFQ